MSPHAALRVLVGSLLLLVVACAVRWSLAATSTTGPFLPTAPCGEWQRTPLPFDPTPRDATAELRQRFRVISPADVTVWSNGAINVSGRPPPAPSATRLTSAILTAQAPATFEVVIRGRPPIVAVCPANAVLEALVDDHWRPGASVASERTSQIGQAFPSVGEGLQRVWPWLLLAWVALAAVFSSGRAWPLSTRHTLLLLTAVALIVGVNNLFYTPEWYGYDQSGHLEYIEIIANESRIPLAGDGWETFQSPLYYFISSFGYRICEILEWSPYSYIVSAKVVSVLAGVLQIAVTWWAARECFEDRTRQILASLFSAAIPMIIIIGQMPSNESLCGLLGGAVSAFAMFAVSRDITVRQAIFGGVLFGLALLTKVSAVLMAGPLLVAFLCRGRNGLKPFIILMFSAALVCGWYYLRNLVRLGGLFHGNWSHNFSWWQDPGIRVPSHFLRFGEALHHPIFAGVTSFWDSLYATLWSDSLLGGTANAAISVAWNHHLAAAIVGLALVPTAATLLAPATFWMRVNPRRIQLMIAFLTVFLSFAAILDYALQLPLYSAAKSTYAVAAAPALCVVMMAALGPLLEVKRLRPWVVAAVVVFAGCVQVAYFAGAPTS